MVRPMSGPIHLVYGDDDLSVVEQSRRLIEQFLPEPDRAFGLDVVDGAVETVDLAIEVVKKTLGSLMTLPFMGGRKVTHLKAVSFLADNPKGRSEDVKAALTRLSAVIERGIPDGQMFVISAPALDRRMAFYRSCKDKVKEHSFVIPEKDKDAMEQAEQVVAKTCAKLNLTLAGEAQDRFLDKVGADTRAIVNELTKLSLYIGNRPAQRDDIDAITSTFREVQSWDLQDAIGHRDIPGALSVLHRLLAMKESPIGLIFQIESRIRDLLLFREAIQKQWLRSNRGGRQGSYTWQVDTPEAEEILSSRLGKDPRTIHPFRVGLLADQAQRYTAAELRRALVRTARAHLQLVSSTPPALYRLTLEALLVDVMQQRQSAPGKQLRFQAAPL